MSMQRLGSAHLFISKKLVLRGQTCSGIAQAPERRVSYARPEKSVWPRETSKKPASHSRIGAGSIE